MAILAAALLFSTGGAAIKLTSLSAWQIAGLRSGIAAATLLVLLPEARRGWSRRPALVGLSYASTMICFVLANKMTTAANTIFLQSTAPLYIMLLSPWLLAEPVRRRQLAFMAALGLGLALFFVGEQPSWATAPEPLRGNLVAVLSGVFWALTIVGLRWLGRATEPGRPASAAAAVVLGNLAACLTAAPFALPLPRIALGDLAIVAFLGVFQIALAYVFLVRGVARVSALESSLLLLLEPVLSPLWAWLLHGERPTAWALLGGVVILAATAVFAATADRSVAPNPEATP
jgi:drug/metabolite transporter (DMT)-like permease